eukprot:TRINITY_DN9767_c0_g1_i1.p1 TRINITY_DN9767_c0_g1~~TRINITY_DN9767_c0_g1_i1.p1  ORF type:complete len:436 (+),score=80.29 TRINITY_DN9767_c0_g1_i1:913-2220(+)
MENLQTLLDTEWAGFPLQVSLDEDLASVGGFACSRMLADASRAASERDVAASAAASEELVEYAWERLHHGYWKDVPMVWREVFSFGALLKALTEACRRDYGAAMKTLDLALLMGSPKPEWQERAQAFIAALSAAVSADSKASLLASAAFANESDESEGPATIGPPEQLEDEPGPKRPKLAADDEPLGVAVPRVSAPSMEQFYRAYMKPQRPVVITDAMKHWPALNEHPWADLDYLKRCAGLRTVPIEIGSHYLDDNWSQKLMTFNEFVDSYVRTERVDSAAVSTGRAGIGYLAQTPLFDQIPQLRDDISTPLYCSLTEGPGEDLITNAWFGPKGTISPLHYDPYHNLLSQVVGEKYVRLYAPEFSDNLYPHTGKMLFNSSQVDAENPDREKFPLFSQAPYFDCVLRSGEMLYIPPKWWHYVRSRTVSFSVSFWWM